MANRIGQHTVVLENRPKIVSGASVVGKKEGEGPLGDRFDQVVTDDLFGEESWEKAEARFHYTAVSRCLEKGGITASQADVLLGGDLLNQIIASSLAARELSIPYLGLYGACSTMTEGLAVASMLVDGGAMRTAVCAASSHFCSAERQYRFPLEYGCQRTPTAQWTVTGAGALLISGDPVARAMACCTHATIGRVIDLGIADANNMGAAMAPAACDTLLRHFGDTNRTPDDYDLIITGDLGHVGRNILLTMMQERGMPLTPDTYIDCGAEIFSEDQQVNAGGSGCGCSAVVFCGHILPQLADGTLRRVLFMATGALLSLTSSQQGGTIPGVAHAVALEGASV